MPGEIAQPGASTRWLTTFLNVPLNEIIGCTVGEIAEIEEFAGRSLPLAYRQWLLEAGKRIGSGSVSDHFQRSHLLYPDMFEVRDIAEEVVLECQADVSLLDRAFPFFNWEVYRLCLLDLSQSLEDPPVLGLNEHTGNANLWYRSFSQFIGWEIFVLADALAIRNE